MGVIRLIETDTWTFAEKRKMTRSYCRLWTHAVFSTKNRLPLITRTAEQEIYDFLRLQLKKIECVPLSINGMSDHVHLLYLANHKLSTAEILKQVKGSSSYWINANKMVADKFGWQDGYCALSVSESAVQDVKRYIANQKIHHAKRSFTEECEELFRDLAS